MKLPLNPESVLDLTLLSEV